MTPKEFGFGIPFHPEPSAKCPGDVLGGTMKKILCAKETRPDTGTDWCVWRLDKIGQLADMLDGAEAGEKILLEICEMAEDELAALPEFEGW